MKQEWIDPYIANISGPPVHLPGNNSCSRSLKVALSFALNSQNPDTIPIIFLLACKNFTSPAGMAMNNEAYTAYPSEGEVLLVEGCSVHVLAFQENFELKNHTSCGMEKYNGRKINIIYLYHDC